MYTRARVASRALPISTVALALVLGVALRHRALESGFWADDYLHQAMLHGTYPTPRAPWDLFRFAQGDTARLVDVGYYPWWTHPDFRLSMLRPAASLLHALDYRAFGLDAAAHHWHSLAWWALCVVAVATLLFSLLPRIAAAVAVVLFALDESHTIPVVWLSNRSLLIATACSAAALWLHVRWRRGEGGRVARASSIALFALALLSGEYALSMFGYLLSYELVSRRGDPLAMRARALLPAGALALLFVGLWAALGYGTAHSGLYANPVDAPHAYAINAAAGVPVLLGDLVLSVPADWWIAGSPWIAELRAGGAIDAATWARMPGWRAAQIAIGLFGALLAYLLLRWLQRRSEPADVDALPWLGAGALLGLLPVLGSFISSRLVLPASIAFAALFGTALVRAATELRSASISAPARALVATAVALLVLTTQIHHASVIGVKGIDYFTYATLARTQWPLGAEIDDRLVAGQQIVMVNAADPNDAPYLPFVRAAYGHPSPRAFRLLSGSPARHDVRRVDERTLELVVLDSVRLTTIAAGSLTRGRHDRLRAGQRFELPGLRVDVLATNAGQPVHTRYSFDVPLEHPSLLWLHSTSAGLRRLQLPSVGTALQLPTPVLPRL
jgi:hypothetical protein